MQSRLLRSWNCNGIQTATNIPAAGGETAVACETICTKPLIQTQAVRRQVTVTTDKGTLNGVTAHAKPCVTHGAVVSREPGK